jgi:hypothetical protein
LAIRDVHLHHLQIMDNWSRHYLSSVDGDDNAALGEKTACLPFGRNHRTEMLMVQNQAWLIHYYFADTLARHAFRGCRCVHNEASLRHSARTRPCVFGRRMQSASAVISKLGVTWICNPVSDAPKLYNQWGAWYRPTVPAYAFLVDRPLLVPALIACPIDCFRNTRSSPPIFTA